MKRWMHTAIPGHEYRLGWTARGAAATDPVGHAATSHRTGRSRRSRFAALCGAPLLTVSRAAFDPGHARACAGCAGSIEASQR